MSQAVTNLATRPIPASRVRRSAADRLARAATAAVAAIPRQQLTPNMPRIATSGTLLGIALDESPTQVRPPATTALRRKAATLTFTDFFSGAGGTSLGALRAGIGSIAAYNHWPEAVACHAANVPGRHYVADLSLVADLAGAGVMAGPGVGDPAHAELFGSSDLLWGSPPCPPFSQARRAGKVSMSDTRTAADREAALKKARGSMFTPLDFVYAHRDVKVAITENVVELHRWEGLRGWLTLWADYGYETFPVYLNSQFVGPLGERAPQSRDRLFFVHIRREYAPRLDLTWAPEAECGGCRRTVAAVQTWKNGRTFGKYGPQYVYCCPRCGEPVTPPTRGLDVALDVTDPGTPISGRTLGATTLARIQAGLDRLVHDGLPAQPLVVTQDRSNQPDIKPARPWTWTGQTLTGRQVLGLVTHPDLLAGDTRPARRMPRAEDCDFRMVSPRELSTIAGFPEDYVWVGSKRDIALATGNAVTPRVAQHLLERVVAALP